MRLAVAAPGGEPDAGGRAVFGRRLADGRKPVGEIRPVKLPEGRVVVPAIIEHERVQLNPALDHEFLAKSINDVQRAGFIVFVEIPEVVPGVVVQEGAVRMRAFALQIAEQETAPGLTRGHKAHHERGRIAFPRRQRGAARQKTAHKAHFPAVDRQGMFHAKEHGVRHHRRTVHDTRGVHADQGRLQQQDAIERHFGLVRVKNKLLAQIARAVAQDGVPGHAQVAVRTDEFGGQLFAGQALGKPRGLRIHRQRFELDRARQFEVGGVQKSAVGQQQAEQFASQFDGLARALIL